MPSTFCTQRLFISYTFISQRSIIIANSEDNLLMAVHSTVVLTSTEMLLTSVNRVIDFKGIYSIRAKILTNYKL